MVAYAEDNNGVV